MSSQEGISESFKSNVTPLNQDQSNTDFIRHKRKRRSKNDSEGRTFVCEECGKSYLSQPALTNHKKTKHETAATTEKRGRGRPRKNNPAGVSEDIDKRFKTYFSSDPSRNKKEGESEIKISLWVNKIFESINQEKYSTFLYKGLMTDPSEHTFLKFASSKEEQPKEESKETNVKIEQPQLDFGLNLPSENQQNVFDSSLLLGSRQDCEGESQEMEAEEQFKGFSTADEVFYAFLSYVAKKTNHDYFVFTFKFVVLFREAMNIHMRNESDDKSIPEYTINNDADQAPEMCNTFVTDYMEGANYFGDEHEKDKIALIEIIQYFCYWLYYFKYTSSKLTLLSN